VSECELPDDGGHGAAEFCHQPEVVDEIELDRAEPDVASCATMITFTNDSRMLSKECLFI